MTRELTQTERVVRFIAEHPGCTVMDLTRGLDPFVANVRARISDARAVGHNIECRKVDRGNGFYIVPQRVPDTGEQVPMFGDAAA